MEEEEEEEVEEVEEDGWELEDASSHLRDDRREEGGWVGGA